MLADNIRYPRFNSTLVWLKEDASILSQCPTTEFQFHAGLIKSFMSLNRIKKHLRFQFHAGLIKSQNAKSSAGAWGLVSIPRWSD